MQTAFTFPKSPYTIDDEKFLKNYPSIGTFKVILLLQQNCMSFCTIELVALLVFPVGLAQDPW